MGNFFFNFKLYDRPNKKTRLPHQGRSPNSHRLKRKPIKKIVKNLYKNDKWKFNLKKIFSFRIKVLKNDPIVP